MKANLTYDLPEENAAFLAASRGTQLLTTLHDIANECRMLEKTDGMGMTTLQLADRIRGMCWDELCFHDEG
jgi:hypothetical protein